jgi:hypothetical protein
VKGVPWETADFRPAKYLSPITFHLSPVITGYSVFLTPAPPGFWLLRLTPLPALAMLE